MDVASPRSPLPYAAWLWIIVTIVVLTAGPLFVGHARSSPMARSRPPPVPQLMLGGAGGVDVPAVSELSGRVGP